MAVLTYREPTTVAEACALLAADPETSTVVAGGTAAVIMLRQRLISPEHLIDIRAIPALHGILRTGTGLRIGAAVTLREIAAAPEVRAVAPSLATACGQVGNPRVRNTATIGGNLAEADYASDPPSVLASLGATCHLVGPAGQRDLPVDHLITGFYATALRPGELITAVDVPGATAGTRRHAVYLKYRSRSSEDRACVGVAARVDLTAGTAGAVADLDVVVGAVAATPQRVPDALRDAAGGRLDGALADRVARRYAEAIEPLDDARGSRWYRRQLIAVLVRRALAAVADLSEASEGARDG